MSSASSHRYQSKVFNFVNQHSRRLGQRLEKTIRNLQVSTKWTFAAILYPLHQLFQLDELVEKRLQAKTQPSQVQLESVSPPAADKAIQHILELVKNLPSAAASESQTSQNVKSWSFLGNALGRVFNRSRWSKSDLGKKLQPEDTLQYHIPTIQGIAVNLENRDLVLVTEKNTVLDVLTIQQQKKLTDKLNSEIAEYWHYLNLVKTKQEQELLPAIDQISTITDSPVNSPIWKLQSYPGKIFGFLDRALANLEAKALVPLQQHSQGIIQVTQIQVQILIYGKEKVEARRKIVFDNHGLENQSWNISELIAAASNYFLGRGKIPKISGDIKTEKLPHQPVNQFLVTPQIQSSNLIANSWLTWGDLFGDLEISGNSQSQLSNPYPSSLLTVNKSTVTANYQYQIQPDLIETSATFLGYEKHPLEKILAWLDHLMLWIEMIFMNGIYFFKGLLQI